MMNRLPEWAQPVVDYILHVALKNTLIIASTSVVLSVVIGVVLGTLLTLDARLMRMAVRLYIEIWRGLPIIVTIFLLYFALPTVSDELHFPAARLGPVRGGVL